MKIDTRLENLCKRAEKRKALKPGVDTRPPLYLIKKNGEIECLREGGWHVAIYFREE